MGQIVKMIPMCEEDIQNLKSAIEKLKPISDPADATEIFTMQAIIKTWDDREPLGNDAYQIWCSHVQ